MIDPSVSIKYMLAGYIVIVGVITIYLLNLFFRWRNLKRDLHTLEEMEKK